MVPLVCILKIYLSILIVGQSSFSLFFAVAEFHSELTIGTYSMPSPAVKKTDIPSHQAFSLADNAAIRKKMKSRMRDDKEGKCNRSLRLLTYDRLPEVAKPG